jgi:hypothetical protein
MSDMRRGIDLIESVCERLRAERLPRFGCPDARYHGEIHRAQELRPATVVKLPEKTVPFAVRSLRAVPRCAVDFKAGLDSDATYEPGVVTHRPPRRARSTPEFDRASRPKPRNRQRYMRLVW